MHGQRENGESQNQETAPHPRRLQNRVFFVKKKDKSSGHRDSLTFLLPEVCLNAMDLLFRDDQAFMREALRLATKAAASEEVPIGAVIAKNGRVIGRGYNQ